MPTFSLLFVAFYQAPASFQLVINILAEVPVKSGIIYLLVVWQTLHRIREGCFKARSMASDLLGLSLVYITSVLNSGVLNSDSRDFKTKAARIVQEPRFYIAIVYLSDPKWKARILSNFQISLFQDEMIRLGISFITNRGF